jgi:hypothetical protein
MFDSDILVYTALVVSLSVSAIQICQWLLNANPRAVLNAGQWSVAGLIGLTPALLLWLVMSGRSALALMLASFILPALIWGAPRWRALSGSLSPPGSNFPRWGCDFSAPIGPGSPPEPDPANLDLVQQSIAVLTAYLERAAGQARSKPTRMLCSDRLLNGPGNTAGRRRMSTEEALDVLGLEATAAPDQISEAHRRLHEMLQPELGNTHYLIMKVDEARNILLLEAGRGAQA